MKALLPSMQLALIALLLTTSSPSHASPLSVLLMVSSKANTSGLPFFGGSPCHMSLPSSSTGSVPLMSLPGGLVLSSPWFSSALSSAAESLSQRDRKRLSLLERKVNNYAMV